MARSYAEGVVKERIIETLRQHPEGLTIHDISRLIGTHRHTATRYLAELKGAEIIICRPIGSATLHYLECHLNNLQNKASKNIEQKLPNN